MAPLYRGYEGVLRASHGIYRRASREEFEKTRLVYDATLRNLELIGEAARNVPDEVRAKAPDVPWRRVVAVRNILIHGYLGIDNDVIWDIVQNEIGKLLRALEKLDS